jgi:hypothetical protein
MKSSLIMTHTLYGTLNARPLARVVASFLLPRKVAKKKLLVCLIFRSLFRRRHVVWPARINPVFTRPATGPCGPVVPVGPVEPVGPVAPVGPSMPSKFTL